MLIFVLMAALFRTVFTLSIFTIVLGTMDSCRKKGPYNPYLHMKTKPSEQQLKVDKRTIKKGNKEYKKLLGDNRKFLFGRRRPPKQ